MLQVGPSITLLIFLNCRFIENKLYVQFYYKVEQALLQGEGGRALLYYKAGQVLLQVLLSGTAFLHYKMWQVTLQSRESITKWGYYDKVGQYNLHVDRLGKSSLRIPKKLNFCYNHKEE